MAFSTIVLIMGVILLVTSLASSGSDLMFILGVLLSSSGLSSLVIYLIDFGSAASLITVLSMLVIVAGAYAIYMISAKKIEAHENLKSNIP